MAAFFDNILGSVSGGAFASNIGSLIPNVFSGGVINRRQQFISVLNQWWSTPAMPFLWLVAFDFPSLLNDASMNLWGEVLQNSQPWGVDEGIGVLHKPFLFSGCMFAQGITFPKELLNVEYVGQYNRGFAYSPVVNHRVPPQNFTISLYETNASFTDSILRPWTVLASHYGPVARPGNQTIKADMYVFELAKTGNYFNDVLPRKVWLFQNCFPQAIEPYTYQYTPDQPISIRETTWTFTRYQIMNKFPPTSLIRQ